MLQTSSCGYIIMFENNVQWPLAQDYKGYEDSVQSGKQYWEIFSIIYSRISGYVW